MSSYPYRGRDKLFSYFKEFCDNPNAVFIRENERSLADVTVKGWASDESVTSSFFIFDCIELFTFSK